MVGGLKENLISYSFISNELILHDTITQRSALMPHSNKDLVLNQVVDQGKISKSQGSLFITVACIQNFSYKNASHIPPRS